METGRLNIGFNRKREWLWEDDSADFLLSSLFIRFSWIFHRAKQMTVSCDVHWLSSNEFQHRRQSQHLLWRFFNCHSCTVSGMLLKSLLDIILTRIPRRRLLHEVKTKTVVNAPRLYLFALSLRRLRRLRVSLFHFNEWTISVSWITLARRATTL